MKSLINVRYNVYAPKAERNRATFESHHMDRLSAQIKDQTAVRREHSQLTRADVFTRSHEH